MQKLHNAGRKSATAALCFYDLWASIEYMRTPPPAGRLWTLSYYGP